ncbi:Fur family transcriptional regulator [Spirochaeta cellobiosiphila]|uniref:Fur family transcriptional regulator n=1 Tax=Spirochaeta cellobiosiphila TaxID=504483 RepID=UPI0003FA6FCC|nr:transcriptional repressor [Spirochaeta cellobiosiphila]
MRMTKQRQTILDVLKMDKTHPDAESLYYEVRKLMPNISLGTVYRNLDFLADQGLIKRLHVSGRQMHFDGDMDDHHHFECRKCGKIIDVPLSEEPQTLSLPFDHINGRIDGFSVSFYGVCEDCSEN